MKFQKTFKPKIVYYSPFIGTFTLAEIGIIKPSSFKRNPHRPSTLPTDI